MKILLIAPQPFFEERGTPIAVRWLVQTLCRAGHRVDLLSYHCGEDIDEPGLRIYRCAGPKRWTSVPIGFSLRKLVLDVALTFSMIGRICREHYDVVHAVEESVFPALLFKGRKKAIYDMDSSMADQIVEKWPKASLLAGFLRFFERRACRSADLVLAVCPYLVELAEAAQPAGRVVLLPDHALEGADEKPEGLDDLRALAGTRKLLLYVGNLEFYQGVGLLLDAVELSEHRNEICCVIVGGTEPDVIDLQKQVIQRQLDKEVHVMGPRPLDWLAYLLIQADMLVSPRLKGKNTPLKIYSYMLTGRAILATAIESHNQVLNNDCAKLAAPEASAMAAAMDELLCNEALRGRLGNSAKQLAEQRHTSSACAKILLEAYRGLDSTGNDTFNE